jgi:hypothetical protein
MKGWGEMAKENQITTCYNWETNETIALYESFGWELVSNNIVSSVKTDSDVQVAAENELTFSRDKDAPWYAEVNKLQQEFIKEGERIDEIKATDPTKEMKFHWILFILLCAAYSIGLIYLIGYLICSHIQKKKEKKWHQENDPKIDEISKIREEIILKSRAIVNAGN